MDYTFDLTAMQLIDGVHVLQATAYDDFWKAASVHVGVLLTTGGSQMQSASVSSIALAEATQSQTPGVPKKKRYAQNVQQLSLKHALKVLQSWKKSQSTDQQKWATVAEHLVQGWIAKGYNLAKGNTSQMNAIAFMLYKLGGYKKSDACPARAGRRDMSGRNKCTTAAGDAYVLGNKHKKYRWGRDWPTKGGDWPENAYHLSNKSYHWPCLSILSNPEKGAAGDVTARGGLTWPLRRQVGHAGLFIAKDTTISASPDHGIRFNDWIHSYRDFDSNQQVLTRHYTK